MAMVPAAWAVMWAASRPGDAELEHAAARQAADLEASVGRALRPLQEGPAERWTIDALAREAGVWRSTLARSITDVVGQPQR